ncbi:1-aminocyclopropane-1-carboxylate synthase-like [Impatiens glandulifera]|uniref:1-aminocyclopropane-1-carboxylate synthase-like n=1 Tax=Impatiens glandulifera TaxID=253017 RepID=UPI001FB09F20|nr:1-aminocyclopropane-1-carboxylate synthase-like [Impatiens glandulifera]
MNNLRNGNELLSKIAINDKHGEDSPYFDGWKAYDNDPFHPKNNPNGVIQMGLAENQLSSDLIVEWIKKNPKASICTYDGVDVLKEIANFQDYHGLPQFRNAMAKFMGRVRGGKVRFEPDRIVMGGGATGANELLMFCLANEGDAFLIPSPYYPGFDRDLRWRTGIQLVPIVCESSNNFELTIEALEEAYENAIKANIKVKGIILSNPSNPLGTSLNKATFKSLVHFVNRNKIHLVCDEIYSATIFRGPKFVSLSEILQEIETVDNNNIVINRNLFHIVYSLSKDMGLPGFRVGIVYSYNDDVVSCARKMSSFGLVSSQTQHFLASLLSDEEFVNMFLSESAKRLAERYMRLTEGLIEVGIRCLESNGGLYCWMDLRNMLKNNTIEDEMELWKVIINDVKLNVSPGSSFHCKEPGWFRACFANMDDETVEIALVRIRKFVDSNRTKKNKKKNLRVSFSPRMYDERVMVMSSPHSPVPHSPLLQATT